VVRWSAAANAPAVSSGSAGRMTSRFGMTRRAADGLDGLVRGAVLADADGVVSE